MTERNKVVIRHLPPALPEEVFWKTLSPWIEPINESPAKCLVTYKSYIPGKLRQNKGKVDLPSRAYLHFATVEHLVEFHQGYAQQAFRDSRGNITMPKIEFAPFQKIPTPAKKVDPRCGTIESSQDYQLFLKRLESPSNETLEEDSNQPILNEENSKIEIPKITPLIQHLRSLRKSAQEASTAQKVQQRNALSGSKVKDPDLPPHQIIKRGNSSNIPSSGSLPPTSSSKQSKSRPAPPSSKSSKVNSTSFNGPKSAGISSVPKPSVIDPVEPKPQAGPSKPKRGKRGMDHPPQSKGMTDPSSSNPKPIPIKIVTRPKEILTNPTLPISGATETSKNSKGGGQEGSQNQKNNVVTSQEGKGNGKKGGGSHHSKGLPPNGPTSRTTSSKRNPASTPQGGTPSAENTGTNESKNNRPRGTEEAAGARRRLGMALAGIVGAPTERRASRKEVQNHGHST
ncbi:Smg-4/UPF3 family-domain-containing protein [Melampsora americana]|nr:Smg-4/UPF3 family-domain-containing protein [Melampsora americana]